MQITGRLIKSTPVEVISEKFRKTNVILETEHETQYPQEICVECHNDNIDKLKTAGVKAGDIVTIEVNLRGKRYEKEGAETRWFNTLVMWKINKDSAGNEAPAKTPAYSPPANIANTPEEDDLPFN